jgi:hypothetical protein
LTNGLEHFEQYGDAGSLLQFVREGGGSLERYEHAIEALAPVFEGLTHGERPSYERLDRDRLTALKPEVEQIVRWICASNKADIMTRGIELMGVLGYESFAASLESYVLSKVRWQRLTAIAALGSFPGKRAAELINIVAADPDPEVRAEALRAAKTRRGNE